MAKDVHLMVVSKVLQRMHSFMVIIIIMAGKVRERERELGSCP